MIVLDTNVLSESFRSGANPRVVEFVANTRALAVTSVTVFELLEGISMLPEGNRRRVLAESVESVLRVFESRVLPYTTASARLHATQDEARRRSGRPISMEDGMIAAICREHGATLATRNSRDFECLGINLINPWDKSESRLASSPS